MHERNQYKTPPDFESLAHAYPPLQPHVIRAPEDGSPTIDFHDETAQRRLTQALLFRDFDIQLEIPDDRLCPPVPNRTELRLVVARHPFSLFFTRTAAYFYPRHRLRTGASAIYPLLACRLSPNWRIVATVYRSRLLRPMSTVMASPNASTSFVQTPTGPILFPLIQDPAASFDFSMCNPPFYASAEEVVRSATAKALSPNAVRFPVLRSESSHQIFLL
ncbi:ribosomal RNA large subunit methyltransferase F-like protein [Lactarius hatsudake]|nr:ribosomal RNA large subunit methyltransferase F-like protein [Lactarius hatsudake]